MPVAWPLAPRMTRSRTDRGQCDSEAPISVLNQMVGRAHRDRRCPAVLRSSVPQHLWAGEIATPLVLTIERVTQPPIDVAIIGVPKSGTTSLYAWLAAHPGVQGSEPKETLYFIERDSKLLMAFDGDVVGAPTFDDDGWEGFERFFPEPRDGRLRLEASPSNLYHRIALRALTSVEPPPLVIIALRCPAEQIRSAFYFAQNNGAAGRSIDARLTFPAYVEALLAGDSGVLERAVPDDQLRWYLTEILHHNTYVDWLDQWAAKLPSENLLAVRFDDVAERPREVLDDICKRAGLDPSFYENYEFARLNPTLAQANSRFRSFALALRRALPAGRVRDSLAKVYRRLPAGQYLGMPSAEETAAMVALGRYFEPDNQALAEKYGIDVSPWWPREAS